MRLKILMWIFGGSGGLLGLSMFVTEWDATRMGLGCSEEARRSVCDDTQALQRSMVRYHDQEGRGRKLQRVLEG